MNTRTYKLMARVLLSTCVAPLAAVTVSGQTAPTRPLFPNPPEGSQVWEAHVLYVIDQHRREGTSETALGEPLNIAYAKYAQCVMGGCDLNEEDAVAALDQMQLVLSRGRTVAVAGP